MGWANLSINNEISEIEESIKVLKNDNPETAKALKAIIDILKKLEESMDNIAYSASGNR